MLRHSSQGSTEKLDDSDTTVAHYKVGPLWLLISRGNGPKTGPDIDHGCGKTTQGPFLSARGKPTPYPTTGARNTRILII